MDNREHFWVIGTHVKEVKYWWNQDKGRLEGLKDNATYYDNLNYALEILLLAQKIVKTKLFLEKA